MRPFKVPVLFVVNWEYINEMATVGVEAKKEVELREITLYALTATEPYREPIIYNNGQIVLRTLINAHGSEYSTPLTQEEILNLYNQNLK